MAEVMRAQVHRLVTRARFPSEVLPAALVFAGDVVGVADRLHPHFEDLPECDDERLWSREPPPLEDLRHPAVRVERHDTDLTALGPAQRYRVGVPVDVLVLQVEQLTRAR